MSSRHDMARSALGLNISDYCNTIGIARGCYRKTASNDKDGSAIKAAYYALLIYQTKVIPSVELLNAIKLLGGCNNV